MVLRLDQIEGIKANLYSWYYESKEKIYDKLPNYWKKISEQASFSEIKGGYWKGTSSLGAMELEDRTSLGQYSEDTPQEGFTVFGTIKDKALKIQVPREFKRDWHRTEDFLKDQVKGNWPKAVEVTKEQLVANMYNFGGYTSGDDIFDNDDSGISLTTYASPKKAYDGKPFLNLTNNKRSAKFESASNYYNAVAVTTGDLSAGVTYDNAKDMWNLLTSTNNRSDSGKYFDNSQNVSILCHTRLKLDWDVINNSTLNPDNAMNPTNPLKGAFREIIANPYLNTNTFSAFVRGGIAGVRVWFSEPIFNFWEKYDPKTYWASVVLDYAIAVINWRPVVVNNAPES